MGFYKNIKRNKTRPSVNRQPYVQSMMGNKKEKKVMDELRKLDEWRNLGMA